MSEARIAKNGRDAKGDNATVIDSPILTDPEFGLEAVQACARMLLVNLIGVHATDDQGAKQHREHTASADKNCPA